MGRDENELVLRKMENRIKSVALASTPQRHHVDAQLVCGAPERRALCHDPDNLIAFDVVEPR